MSWQTAMAKAAMMGLGKAGLLTPKQPISKGLDEAIRKLSTDLVETNKALEIPVPKHNYEGSNPLSFREKMAIQGGPRSQTMEPSRIMKFMKDHGLEEVENEFDAVQRLKERPEESGNFTWTNEEGKVVTWDVQRGKTVERKTWNPNTKLGTLRDWMGY